MHTVKNRLARNCIPCLGETRAKLYTLFKDKEDENHTLSSGTSPYKGAPPPPPSQGLTQD